MELSSAEMDGEPCCFISATSLSPYLLPPHYNPLPPLLSDRTLFVYTMSIYCMFILFPFLLLRAELPLWDIKVVHELTWPYLIWPYLTLPQLYILCYFLPPLHYDNWHLRQLADAIYAEWLTKCKVRENVMNPCQATRMCWIDARALCSMFTIAHSPRWNFVSWNTQ